MRRKYKEFASPLSEPIRCFIAHKRALNRRFDCEKHAIYSTTTWTSTALAMW
jgi:hypothetical protein